MPADQALKATRAGAPLTTSELDAILTAQLAVAWAGEGGEEPRLKWWRTDMVSEFGGEDLFKRLLPNTWQWAVVEAVREAAKRRDAELRAKDANPDSLLTLFHLGYEIDERLDERLHDLKRVGGDPSGALPNLTHAIAREWDRQRFADWVDGHGEGAFKQTPTGRELKARPPGGLDALVRCLVAALGPLGDAYPMPYFRAAA
jgi:hypothetical protein